MIARKAVKRLENQHWQWFSEFCKYERLTGGPDPHMRAVIELSRDLPLPEQVWRVACYVGVYNVPSAEAIWSHWTGPQYLENTELFHAWLETHWKGLKLRRERRTVKSPIKLSTYFEGYEKTVLALTNGLKTAPFEQVWDFAMALPHVGRYAATKLTECWYRLGLVQASVEDIRAHGGWSPRETLALLFPEAGHDPKRDAQDAMAEGLARYVHGRLREKYNIALTFFELEVLLCEYKASYSTKRQYPGRSLDSELSYERAIAPYWKRSTSTDHMRIRPKLSPKWALGEVQGWEPDERLKNLGKVVSEYGYTWTDSLYDYQQTRDRDLWATPVEKARIAVRA